MQRALFSGVTGLTNHQAILDITANNLANVSTNGFKASRLSFSTALNQTSFAGAAPAGTTGGTNPRQIGLGVTTSTIDVDMRQGSLNSTGRTLDLAIQGSGMFQVTDGTRQMYSRVGNFGVDSNSNLVDLGSGLKVVGNTYGPASETVPTAFGVPIAIPAGSALPSKLTSTITMQGNLSSTEPALQGSTVQSLFPLTESATGQSAADSSLIKDLTLFKSAVEPASPLAQMKTVNIFGTKNDGTGYTGAISINPWHDTVSDLVGKINGALTAGTTRFGTVSLNNGTLSVAGSGTGSGFSLFLGDTPGTNLSVPDAGLTDATGAAYAGTGALATLDVGVAAQTGRLQPVFIMPATDYSGQAGKSLTLTVNINGTAAGTITVPADNYAAATAKRTFTLGGLPPVTAGDAISYTVSGTLNTGASNLTWSSNYVAQADVQAMTADTNNDGTLDMYDASATAVTADPNAWQYSDTSNTGFNWYRSRFVPSTVTSSIEVYDPLGQKHLVETRMFRTGTKADPNDPSTKRMSWDMVMSVKPGEAVIVDDVVAGVEFDQKGRFSGDVGKSVKGNTLTDNGYVGDPSSKTVRFDWGSTGTSSPSTLDLDLGQTNGVNGLTGFGSVSSAAAVKQDGYADGRLDTLSVSKAGDIVGLYTNGISRKIAQVQIATFANVAGLNSVGANLWVESPNSGTATARIPGSGGAGSITAGALEGSNVDIASEFTRLITAQRGFSVNAKVIQTTDAVLTELAGLIR